MKDCAMIEAHATTGTSTIDTVPSPTDRIRALNDELRRFQLTEAWASNRILLTAGVSALSWADKFALMELVKRFDDFSEANDPHGEHDFGAITFKGERYFWKIDYYDRSLKMGSPDPADPRVTTRVLTVMLASEY
jgi:hypothetical protein